MPDYEEIFNRSYWLTRGNTVNGVSFEDALFDNLLRSCPEVAQRILAGDMEAFRATLMLSIDNLARYYVNGEPTSILQGVARRQSRGERNIEPRLYEFFLQALLQTVQRYDPKYDEEVGKAWEAVLRPGIEYMKRMY
jgi:hemoglobin-like flavoprotein